MTEASHQMTSNPLPPRPRKPGSVGVAAGPDVAIMARDGQLLGPETVGEIVIRGVNVTAGYERNATANAEAFAHGWFHTGDQGTMDAEGYVRVTGRLKEIINRGGEKISPREVDEVIMDHPAVAQAVTFAMPHDKLGEDVAAAVVLREGAQAGEQEIRDFVAMRLADFKVPRRVVILDEIPKRRDRQAAAHRPGREARSRLMRVAIFGAGAIGGYLAAKLAAAGTVELSLVARGAHLDAIRTDGLRLIEGGSDSTHRVVATDDARILGVQDAVLLTLKAQSVPRRARCARPVARTGDGGGDDAERPAVVVLPRSWRSARGHAPRVGRSGWPHLGDHPAGARHWGGGLSRG